MSISARLPVHVHLAVAGALAVLQVAAFAWWLIPGREIYFGDQTGYESLARTLAERGIFARVDELGTAPEPWRTIGYPIFLAVLQVVFGTIYGPALAIQAILAGLLPVFVHRIASHFMSRRAAILPVYAVALYPPLNYYAVFTLSDFMAAFLVTVALAASIDALGRRHLGWALAAGLCFGLASLVRPVFAPFGLGLVVGLLVFDRRRIVAAWRGAALLVFVSIVIGVVPSVAITYANFGRPALVGAGSGLQLWLGYWEGVWSGALTRRILIEPEVPRELPAAERERAAQYRRDYEDLFGTEEQLPAPERVQRWLEADRKAMRLALSEIAVDPAGYIGRGFTFRLPVLWITELPVPDIHRIPEFARALAWAPQALLLALGIFGVVARWRTLTAKVIGLLLLYLSGVHFPLFVAARYSLAAKPVLIIAAVVGAIELVGYIRDQRARGVIAGTSPASAR